MSSRSHSSHRRRNSYSSPITESEDDIGCSQIHYSRKRHIDGTTQVYEHSDSDDDDPSTKRLKSSRRKTTVVDRISMLPDSLLLHILSFLPIEDAIKTDVLSKRWQFLWTSVPSLLFCSRGFDSDDDTDSNRDFVTFVDKTLVLCNCSKLKKFVVDFQYESRLASNVNLWTRFATRNATEELQLKFCPSLVNLDEEDRFLLPQLLFTHSSFRELRFTYCSVAPRIVCWKLLKKLSIGYVRLDNDVIQKILVGSPVLENLELHHFYGITRLNVSKASLKKLILREFWEYMDEEEVGIDNEHNSELEILAPNLPSLEILGCLGRRNCRLADVSSLVDATLNCNFISYSDDRHDDYEWHQNILRELLESLVHVKNLTLGTWVLQVLSIMETKGLRSPLSKCECLTLHTRIQGSVLPGIASLLESCSHLETIAIITSPSDNEMYFYNNLAHIFNFDGKNYWASQKRSFLCLMLRLKIVKFTGSIWCYHHLDFSFLQFLLKNAMVLQKMVINTLGVDNMAQMDLFQAAQKFLSFPRSSPDAIVMFN